MNGPYKNSTQFQMVNGELWVWIDTDDIEEVRPKQPFQTAPLKFTSLSHLSAKEQKEELCPDEGDNG